MNKDKITAMCRKVSNETGLTFNHGCFSWYKRTNTFIQSQIKKLLFSSFDKVYAYEYIIDTELSNNDKNGY